MIQSMTGFGKSEITLQNFHVNIEIRSLNSKFLDLSLKLPSLFKEMDFSVRKLLKENLKRGKIELTIHYEKINHKKSSSLNKEKIIDYHNELKDIMDELHYNSNKNLLEYALRLPDIIQHSNDNIDKESGEQLLKAIEKACKEMDLFRKKEGLALEKELSNYLNNILKNLSTISSFEEERLPKVKNKLLKAIEELELKSKVDEKRLEQELIYYAEKIDITEEKVRLSEHCQHFAEALKENGSGKKLGFITQEMGREINTLGSKANNISIQKLVVGMKDELEKIKEQVLNIL